MRAVASISQSALHHNLSVVRRCAPNSKIVSMVKADAYGHHLDCITPLIDNSDILGVSALPEAFKLRQKTDLPILLLSGIYSNNELQQAIDINCQIVIHNASQITLINQSKQSCDVWIKIDTGMGRLGLSTQEYQQCLLEFEANPLVNIVCIMSHFACADEPNHPLNAHQLTQFKQHTNNTNKRSMANSAAILGKFALFDFVRPGIMLYGVSPFSTQDDEINAKSNAKSNLKSIATLKPVMQLHAPIISIKTLEKNQSVGYGATWIADKKTTIAAIAIGYADGYPRHAKTGTPILINNVLCPLVGRVSMDLITADISNINAKIGDKAILWGADKLSVKTVANHSNTISYELLSGVSSRVSFINCV